MSLKWPLGGFLEQLGRDYVLGLGSGSDVLSACVLIHRDPLEGFAGNANI